MRVAVALLAAAALVQELLLTRIFSATLYYHFAFLAVSLALLGVAAGGAAVQALRARIDAREPATVIGALAFLAAAAFPASLALALAVPFRPGTTPEGLAWIGLVYPALATPFALVGAALAVALTRLPSPGRVYAADLLGSAAGCAAFVPLAGLLDGPGAGFAIAALAALAGAAAALDRGARRVAWAGAAAAAALVGLGVANGELGLLRARHRLGRPVEPSAWERWNALAQVRVERPSSSSRPFGWGLSPRWRPERGIVQASVEIDSGALTVLTGFDGDVSTVEHLRWDITNLGRHLRHGGRSLVLGVGAGRDVLSGIVFGDQAVVGVEVNDLVLDVLTRVHGDLAGHLERRAGVTLVHDEARSWLARDPRRWDLVQMSLVDTAAATGAGAYALVEDGLYTVEGVRLMLRRLAPGGVLSISRWWYGGPEETPAQAARLVALVAAAQRAEGVLQPSRSVILARTPKAGRSADSGDAVVTLLASLEPFPEQDVDRARRACERLDFALVAAPGTTAPEPLATLLAEADPQALARKLPYDVRPSTDDWPFFFHALDLVDVLTGRARAGPDGGQSGFNLRAVEVLGLLLAGACGSTALFVLGPLVLARGPSGRPRASLLVHVVGLGLGYMLVELSLAQRLILFLGHPTYALTVVLLTLVGASGAGSFLAARFEKQPQAAKPILCGLALALASLAVTVPAIAQGAEAWSTAGRIAVAVAVLTPPGVLMGMPFPLALARARAEEDAWEPWYWAVNGAASVAGSVVAVAATLTFGIRGTLLAGAACYLGAAFVGTAKGGRKG